MADVLAPPTAAATTSPGAPGGLPGGAHEVPRAYRVASRERDTADTVTLVLDPVDGGPVAYAAGQFTMLAAFGHREVPISISGDPAGGRLRHTVRAVGAATTALTRAEPGDLLWARGPFGRGWDTRSAAGGDVVVMAGGIGLAPLAPVLAEVLAERDRYGRVSLLYGARTPADVLYPRDLDRWHAGGVDVRVTVDAAAAGWRGRVGLATGLLPATAFEPAATTAFLCGPEVMMRHSAAALADRGVPARRVRLSLERTMRCGVGLCGHCQLRELFICVDGPVVDLATAAPLLAVREL